MKINAIGVTTFGNKSQIMKKAAAGFMAAAGAGIAADTFVKGLSKPEKALEEKITGEDSFIRGNDEGCNPCDWAATDEYHEDPSECCDCSCD